MWLGKKRDFRLVCYLRILPVLCLVHTSVAVLGQNYFIHEEYFISKDGIAYTLCEMDRNFIIEQFGEPFYEYVEDSSSWNYLDFRDKMFYYRFPDSVIWMVVFKKDAIQPFHSGEAIEIGKSTITDVLAIFETDIEIWQDGRTMSDLGFMNADQFVLFTKNFQYVTNSKKRSAGVRRILLVSENCAEFSK